MPLPSPLEAELPSQPLGSRNNNGLFLYKPPSFGAVCHASAGKERVPILISYPGDSNGVQKHNVYGSRV